MGINQQGRLTLQEPIKAKGQLNRDGAIRARSLPFPLEPSEAFALNAVPGSMLLAKLRAGEGSACRAGRPLTTPVVCFRTSRADASPFAALGSSYVMLKRGGGGGERHEGLAGSSKRQLQVYQSTNGTC